MGPAAPAFRLAHQSSGGGPPPKGALKPHERWRFRRAGDCRGRPSPATMPHARLGRICMDQWSQDLAKRWGWPALREKQVAGMDRQRGCGLTVTRLGETTRTASAGFANPRVRLKAVRPPHTSTRGRRAAPRSAAKDPLSHLRQPRQQRGETERRFNLLTKKGCTTKRGRRSPLAPPCKQNRPACLVRESHARSRAHDRQRIPHRDETPKSKPKYTQSPTN